MITAAEIRAACPPEMVEAQEHGAMADLVSKGRVRVGNVSRADFAMWAASHGMRSKIEDHAADHASPLRDAALACRDLIQGAAASLDLSLVPNQMMLGAWVAIGELSQDSADSLVALATVPDPVSVADVIAAMATEE